MELRVLQYFLTVAREQSISAAAESLHLTQPTLSTQLKALEEEVGKQLMIRGTKGPRKITLTEDGILLRKRAEEIMALVKKAEEELASPVETIGGDIHIGAAETQAMEIIADLAKQLQEQYPAIHYNIFSSNREAVLDYLDRGLIDFGIVYGSVEPIKYDFIKVSVNDSWSVMMRSDSPLAQKESIAPEDLWDKPLILSKQQSPILKWLKRSNDQLNITATCNLIYNTTILVRKHFGYSFTLNPPIGEADLCTRPLLPKLEAELYIVWKKYQVFSKASEKLLDSFRKNF